MKLAILGTGKIVEDALFALEPLNEVEKSAIFARPHSKEKAEKLASQYNIKEVYTDVDELLENSEADTVYIGLINSVHFEYSKKALLAGKNVIVEKPFTSNYKEAEELKKIALEKDLFIFEAVTILHNPVFEELQKNLSKLGDIRMMLCNYSQYSSRYDNYLAGHVDHSFDPEFCGGALYDINVYNIHYTVGLFGSPKKANYYPNRGFNGVDTSGTIVMEYDGFSSVCTGAKDSDSPCFISVQGEKGYMQIYSKPNVAAHLKTVYVDESNKELIKDAAGAMVRATITEEYDAPENHHRMTKEFSDFAEIIDNHDSEKALKYLNESLSVVKILEENR